jgi:hypothetical protein
MKTLALLASALLIAIAGVVAGKQINARVNNGTATSVYLQP